MKAMKEMRLKKNFTQEYIAEYMNVSVPTVSRWESGEFLPRADKLIKLAEVYGCSVTDLLKNTDV